MNTPYVPNVIENVKIEEIKSDVSILIGTDNEINNSFIESTHPKFSFYLNILLSHFLPVDEIGRLNKLLVVITPNNTAKIYKLFPQSFKILAKRDISKGLPVVEDDIADITSLEFVDSFYKIEINDDDKIIFLFRLGFRQGLYFDLTGKQSIAEREEEIAYHYKRIFYEDIFDFLANEANFKSLISDGWFPFIRIINTPFRKLIESYSDDSQYENSINNLLEMFPPQTINAIMNSWMSNPIFKEKQEIIESGILAYHQKNYLSCIKILATEIEGIIRYSMYYEKQIVEPQTKDIKEYLVNKGKEKFNNDRALGFPTLFSEYLDDSIFPKFKISKDKNVTSRHSVSHGIAKYEDYTRIRAFQLILTLDQIYFYL